MDPVSDAICILYSYAEKEAAVLELERDYEKIDLLLEMIYGKVDHDG